jgi:hypothetical protein
MKAKPKAKPRAVRVGGLGVSFDMSDRPGLNAPMSALDKSRTPLARMPDMSLRLVGNLDCGATICVRKYVKQDEKL